MLAAGLWLWFDANFERQLREVPVGASAEARRNPFLAAERFLTRIGVDARGAGGPSLLRELPGTGDMLIVDGLPPLNAARRDVLLDWLAAGGRLLVEAVTVQDMDTPAPDAILTHMVGAALRHDGDPPAADEVVAELSVGDRPRPVRVGFEPHWYLEDLHGRAAGDATAAGRPRLLEYRIGDGRLYVVSDSLWLTNDGIGQHDHALLLGLLTADRDRIWLLHDVSVPGLATLLWQSAPAAVVSAALLLAMLLWSQGARLGPLLPAPEPGRRDLLEHLQAAGDFVWRMGRGGLLVARTRARTQQRWLRRHPPLRDLDDAARARRIAELSGLTPRAVHAALYEPVGDAARLVAITATLQQLAGTHRQHH
jgi:hypothetical protein